MTMACCGSGCSVRMRTVALRIDVETDGQLSTSYKRHIEFSAKLGVQA